MVTESPIKMLSEMGMRPLISGGGGDGFNGDELEKELNLLFREQCRQEASDRERELNLYRSGSAPPTVDGSLTAVGGLFGGDGAGVLDYSDNENGLSSEEQLRADPAYLSYYYSHVNLNPRLPPPVLSKEDWRFAQRLHAGNSVIGDRRNVNHADEGGSRSLFSLQPGFNLQKKEGATEPSKAPGAGEWLNNGGDVLIGLSGLAVGGKQKSFAEIFEDDLGHTAPASRHPSRPTSRSTNAETLGTAEMQLAHLHHEIASVDGLRGGGKVQSIAGPVGTSASHTFASVLGGSLSRSTTPDPQLVGRSPSPCLPPVGARIGPADKKNSNGSKSFNGTSSSFADSADIVGAFSGMNLSRTSMVEEDNYAQSNLQPEIEDHQKFLFGVQGGKNQEENHYLRKSGSGHLDLPAVPNSGKPSYPNFGKHNGTMTNLSSSFLMPEEQVDLQRPTVSSASSYLKVPSVNSPGCSPTRYQDNAYAAFTSYGLNGCPINPALAPLMPNHIGTGSLPPLFEIAAAVSGNLSPAMEPRALGGGLDANLSGELQNLGMTGNHTMAASLQMPLMDPLYIQYLRTAECAAQVAANFNNTSMDRNYNGNMGNSYVELLELQKAYLGTLLSSQKQYGMPSLGKPGGLHHNYYGNPSLGLGMMYPGSPLGSPVIPASPVGPGTPHRHGERNFRFPSGMGNLGAAVMGAWHSDTGGMDEGFASSLLEEFKSNKTRCFDLSEIAGHVVEFSADQYGSRFIQQKLETASTEEKNMVFEEIIPQALSLMTDVFGNYVIQKFFEHGSATQRRELANQLTGHVLTLSLQMYGCRVIQKAIEVVDLDQQTKMVAELDGHIMRCVRDQNGNHVIQKCIECIPQDAIHFIISTFYDQVVTLSTHPYGCRVIQRVLEHCDDPKTQQIMMDEILQCVCMLAQDQYGNYVVQHVLEHGKPHERSAIIKKLAGQIVQMSQQKFASNVVEKCLTFGGPAERQILVNEMLGSTDENEPLQAMMKDQFANYVVQKVLETCDDQQRELILTRIKVHLNALKKYTYGKHIVARVEKLVAAGERRIGVQSAYPA